MVSVKEINMLWYINEDYSDSLVAKQKNALNTEQRSPVDTSKQYLNCVWLFIQITIVEKNKPDEWLEDFCHKLVMNQDLKLEKIFVGPDTVSSVQ